MTRAFVLTLGIGVLSACSSGPGGDGSSGGADDSGDAADEDGGSSVTRDTGGTTAEGGDDGDDDGDDCGGFLACEDASPPLEMCDFWAQDCPPGEKCTAIRPSPGQSWDAHVCVPAGTARVGDPCTMTDGPAGTDTCDAVSMCYEVDVETGIGTCVGYCLAPEADPTCPPGSNVITRCRKQTVLNVCVSPCNPLLAGQCPANHTCVASYVAGDIAGFTCLPVAAEGLGGDSCGCANCCAGHHLCVAAADYGPDCAFDLCCTEYCDAEDSSFVCNGTDQVCVALFDPSTPEIGNVGVCEVQP